MAYSPSSSSSSMCHAMDHSDQTMEAMSAPMPHPLTCLPSWASEGLKQVDDYMRQSMISDYPLIADMVHHLMAAGGKRLRPLLTIAAAHMFGYSGLRHIRLAASVEAIHTATLLHDDVIDHSALRRGAPTSNALWGNKASILVGDYLLSQAFCWMVDDQPTEILTVLSEAARVIVRGEIMQLDTMHDVTLSHDRYHQIIAAKTATLFAAAAQVGSMAANATAAHHHALHHYGAALGMAFQMMDDLLDYLSEDCELGKAVGDDFREGKVTLPVLYAYHATQETGDTHAEHFWKRTMVQHHQEPADFQQAQRYILHSGAHERVVRDVTQQLEYAMKSVMSLPAHDARDFLEQLIVFCKKRRY